MITVVDYADVLKLRGHTTEKALEEKYWVNGVGTRMEVSDMTTDHINNCIAFLEKGFYLEKNRKIPVPMFYKGKEELFIEMFREELSKR